MTQTSKISCDQCRTRKIKCVANDRDRSLPCEGCEKLSVECTHAYIKKKPGRKNSLVVAAKARQQMEHIPSNQSRTSSSQLSSSSTLNGTPIIPNYSTAVAPSNIPPHRSPAAPAQIPNSMSLSPNIRMSAGPGSAPGSSSNMNWLDSLLEDTNLIPVSSNSDMVLDSNNSSVNGGGGGGGFIGQGQMVFASDQAQLLSLESPVGLLAYSTTSGTLDISNNNVSNHVNMGIRGGPQLEDLTSWANISHFIALFLKYLYPLLPLVHRPTFSEQLATRRDLVDTDFRALVLSIVAYVISQLPTSRLVNDQFDIEGLKKLQRRCHRSCKALQRTYYGPTTSTQISTIIFDTFYLLSIGLGHTAGARLGQAIQLAYSMGMHSDAKTESLGLDPIEVQLRRRVFWQLYANDKTRAISGLPMMINDFQGVCSLPDPIDDELITTQGSFSQPTSKPSAIAGFVIVSKLFKILSECFFHHRCIINNVPLQTVEVDINWTVGIEDRIHQVLSEFPDIPDTNNNDNTGSNSSGSASNIRNMLAVQRANILITAAICKFALYDLRTALQLDKEQLAKEREGIAREIHSSLMAIPVEDLASNGESVRTKIFHIVCALCDQKPAMGMDQDLILDWYNMFSAVTFVQMPPPPPEAAMESRANSPPPTHHQQSIYPLTTSTSTMNPGSS